MIDVIRRPPNDLARVIDAIGLAVSSTEGTKLLAGMLASPMSV